MAKFVATSDFRNPAPNDIDVGKDKVHELHIHKGARFEIGGELPLEKMSAAERKLVAELNASGRIVYESQTDKVKLIDAEVEAEKKSAAAAAKAAEKK